MQDASLACLCCLKGFTAVVRRVGDDFVVSNFAYVKDKHLGKVSRVSSGFLASAAMHLGVTTATDDGLLSTTQRHDILRHGDSVHDSSSYLSACVRSTGWCAETVPLLAICRNTHTLDHLHFLSVKGDEDRLKSCQEMIQISTLHVRSVTLVHK